MVNALYFILVALSVYTDSFLTPYMGAFGFSLIPTLVYLIYPLLYFKGLIIIPRFAKSFLHIINYTAIVSFLFFIIFIIIGIPLELYGESLPIKFLKLYLTFISYTLYIIILYSLGIRLTTKQVFAPFFVVFVFLTIFAFFEYSAIPYAFTNLHSVSEYGPEYWRIRLFCSEASHTAPIIEVFFLMSVLFSIKVQKSRLLLILTICCFVFQIYVSSSKSLIVVVMIAFLAGNLSYYLKSSTRTKMFMLLFVVPLLVVIGELLVNSTVESFRGDIDESTSTATRSLTTISGYTVGILFPFGTGFFSYLYFFPKILSYYVEEIGAGFNLDEIIGLLNSKTDHALAAQSFFAQSSSYWGILGSIFIMRKLKNEYTKAIKKTDIVTRTIIKTCFICVIINLLFTTGLDFCIQAFIGILIIQNYKRNNYDNNLADCRNAISS